MGVKRFIINITDLDNDPPWWTAMEKEIGIEPYNPGYDNCRDEIAQWLSEHDGKIVFADQGIEAVEKLVVIDPPELIDYLEPDVFDNIYAIVAFEETPKFTNMLLKYS